MTSIGNTPLILIGYWYSEYEPQYPHPKDFVGQTWNEAQRQQIVTYLRNSPELTTYRGYSDCRICGCSNGASEQTDGKYRFPEGLAHYVEKHGVRLPKEVEYYMLVTCDPVLAFMKSSAQANKTDASWWLDNFGDRSRTTAPRKTMAQLGSEQIMKAEDARAFETMDHRSTKASKLNGYRKYTT